MGVEIRDYSGDFADVVELSHRVWTAAYAGRVWFPEWNVAFLNWQFGPGTGAFLAAAYEGSKLVGTTFCVPQSLRIKSQLHPIGLASWCTVDSAWTSKRVALRLIESIRQRKEDARLSMLLGFVNCEEGAVGYRFWRHYAQSHPDKLRFLFRVGYWVKVLQPNRVARASYSRGESIGIRTVGALVRTTVGRDLPAVRNFAAEDFQACASLLDRASASLDWTLSWDRESLARQLASPASETLVLDDKGVRGFASYHTLTFEGRLRLRAALLDLWATGEISQLQAISFLGCLCRRLRERGIDLVVALRSAGMPTGAMFANMFLPISPPIHVCAWFAQPELRLETPATWSLIMR